MSEVIRLAVSERQGDPWAMIGYIIQFEPFLHALDKVVTGVTLGLARPTMTPNPAAHTERGPGFADDYANITTKVQDVQAVDQLSKRYEEQSGALLSRNSKSKVIFLGDWKHLRRRPQLPVNYLKEVEGGKAFGFIVKGTVKETVYATWEDRVRKMRGKFIQWRNRDLPTLHQRCQVVNIYLASTIWYTAQVLPLPPQFTKQINTEIGKFLFRGRITMGRLTLAELSRPEKDGGLGLVNIQNKADSLFLRQTCRMINRRKSGYRHISYWLGHLMGRKITMHDGPRTSVQPPYLYSHMEKLLEKGLEDKTELELLSMQAKGIYTRIFLNCQAPGWRGGTQAGIHQWSGAGSPVQC